MSIFIDRLPHTAASGLKLRPVKPAPSPLEPKKLNFYCTLGLEGRFKRHGFAAEFINFNCDNQLFMRGMVGAKSINKNNGYNNKDFEFCPKISKNGGVISNNFQVFSNYFQEISNSFQWISKRRICEGAILEKGRERGTRDEGNARIKTNVAFKRFLKCDKVTK